MIRILQSVLAGLIVLQGGLPVAGLGIPTEVLGAAELGVGVLVAALTRYLSTTP